MDRAVRAERCQEVADLLDTRRRLMTERHQPAVRLHTERVWTGQAAAASRETLRNQVVTRLYDCALDVAAVSSRLRARGTSLAREAYELSRRAHEAEAALARSAVMESGSTRDQD